MLRLFQSLENCLWAKLRAKGYLQTVHGARPPLPRQQAGRKWRTESTKLKMAWTDKKQVSNLLWPAVQQRHTEKHYPVPLSLLYGSKLWQRGKGKIFCALCVLSECGVSPSIYLHTTSLSQLPTYFMSRVEDIFQWSQTLFFCFETKQATHDWLTEWLA